MLNIGIDARLTYYRDGGISTYIRRLITALAELDLRGEEYTVFHSRRDLSTIADRFRRAGLWTPAHHRLERIALSVELAWRGLDVFHSPDFIPPFRAARRHVITVHDLTFMHYPQYLTAESRAYYNAQIASACHQADHILAVSAATRDDITNLLDIPQAKITVQPHGVSERFRPLPVEEVEPVLRSLNLPSRYILHVGTWEPRKNIIGLVHAFKNLLTEIPDLPPIVLVGREGWLFEQTRQDIQALDIDQHLIWRDNVRDDQLPAVYNAALVNVTVSRYEGFGMPALEGMACGAVPVVSNRSSLPEVVGEVGLQVDPDNIDEIADALRQTLFDTDWAQTQQELAIERASHFTWERSARIARDIYTSVV